MKRWLKEYQEEILVALMVVMIVVGGALLDYYAPFDICGGRTFSEMEALAQEYKDSCEAAD